MRVMLSIILPWPGSQTECARLVCPLWLPATLRDNSLTTGWWWGQMRVMLSIILPWPGSQTECARLVHPLWWPATLRDNSLTTGWWWGQIRVMLSIILPWPGSQTECARLVCPLWLVVARLELTNYRVMMMKYLFHTVNHPYLGLGAERSVYNWFILCYWWWHIWNWLPTGLWWWRICFTLSIIPTLAWEPNGACTTGSSSVIGGGTFGMNWLLMSYFPGPGTACQKPQLMGSSVNAWCDMNYILFVAILDHHCTIISILDQYGLMDKFLSFKLSKYQDLIVGLGSGLRNSKPLIFAIMPGTLSVCQMVIIPLWGRVSRVSLWS